MNQFSVRLLCIWCPLIALGCFETVESTAKVDHETLAVLKNFDYRDLTQTLAAYVDPQRGVDYEALKGNRERLDRFVATLAIVGPQTRPELFSQREEQLAYYINAYNALTLFNVINRMPEFKRVDDDLKSFFYFTRFHLDGAKRSLYQLENDIIRPRFKEPRIHFALNCASMGCPTLPSAPFLPQTLERQLTEETSHFLNRRLNVQIHDSTVTLSKIFKWYADDFDPDPVTWIGAHAPHLKFPEDPTVRYRDYDWTLNGQ